MVLTERQAQVKELLDKGLRQKDIAAVLGISPTRVAQILADLERKGEVVSRDQRRKSLIAALLIGG